MAEKLVQSVTGGRLELLKEAAVMQNFLTYEEISDRFTAPMKHKLEPKEPRVKFKQRPERELLDYKNVRAQGSECLRARAKSAYLMKEN